MHFLPSTTPARLRSSSRAPLARAFVALAALLLLPAVADATHGKSRRGPSHGPATWRHARPMVVAPCPPPAYAPRAYGYAGGYWERVWVPPVVEIRFDFLGRRFEHVRSGGYWTSVWRPAPHWR